MKATQNLPRVRPDAVRYDAGLSPSPVAGGGNLVIENLAEFAAAGVPDACQLCFADCAASPIPGHDAHRSSPWMPQAVS